jgi:chorismate synthase
MTDSHEGRTVHERVGALEQEAAVTRHRLDRFDRDHAQSPNRLTKLEQQFEHMTRQLTAIGESQDEVAGKVDTLSNKLTYGLGAAAVVLAVFDKMWPYIAKGFAG